MERKIQPNYKERATKQLDILIERRPELQVLRNNILDAYELLLETVSKNGKILICGNGGSCADSDHIVGELMKSFCANRPIEDGLREKLLAIDGIEGERIANGLEGAIPAINLTQHTALSTAYGNDSSAPMVFAQQVYGYGKEGDALIAISTSGNSLNVALAAITAKAKGMRVVSLTGSNTSRLTALSDVCLNVPETETYRIQELHLPIYHTLCLMLETSFWPVSKH